MEPTDVGVVVIGRNLAHHLSDCLGSMPECIRVYVDSGSHDGSLELARRAGWDVVSCPPPYCAARARNHGARWLLERRPGLEFLLFVDGDCVLERGWLAAALAHQRSRPRSAACYGPRTERPPLRTVFHRLIAWEWGLCGPGCFGGDVLLRSAAFQELGGYAEMIAGEDPDLSYRLLSAGWNLDFVSLPMTTHRLDMERWSEWWRRSARGGHAYAELAWRHGRRGVAVRESLSVWLWALILPVMAAYWGSAILAVYPIQLARIWSRLRSGRSDREALEIAALIMLGKVPMAFGQLRFFRALLEDPQ